jgi:uncharacterized protein (TIGR02597 family)
LALFLSIASLIPADAQTTATTTPVGFITVTVPAAVDASTPSNKAISIPLYNPADFVSAVASVDSASAFTMTGATWTANQFATTPHFVRIKTGAQVGKFFLIVSNTTNQLTVDTRGAALGTVLAVNDTCEIVPANTLGSIFGTTTPMVKTGATVNLADKVFIWNGSAWDTYYHNGANWRKSGSLANQNNVVIYPDEGLFVARVDTTAPLALTFLGTVPSTAEQSDLAGAGSTFVGNRFPVDLQLVSLGLHLTPNWVSGATVDVADKVFVWNGAAWDSYYYNGTNWRKSGNLANQNTAVIPAGTSLFITRASASAATLTQPLPYTP